MLSLTLTTWITLLISSPLPFAVAIAWPAQPFKTYLINVKESDLGCYLLYKNWIQENQAIEDAKGQTRKPVWVFSYKAQTLWRTLGPRVGRYECRDAWKYPLVRPGESYMSGDFWYLLCDADEVAEVNRVERNSRLRLTAECKKDVGQLAQVAHAGTTACTELIGTAGPMLAWSTSWFPSVDEIAALETVESMSWWTGDLLELSLFSEMTSSLLLPSTTYGKKYRACAKALPGRPNIKFVVTSMPLSS